MELSNTASVNASPPIEGNQAWIGFQQLRFSGGRRTAISWRGDGRKPATRHHWFANNRPPSRPPQRSVSKCVAASKIVVDVVVPLVPPKVSVVQLPQEGSAALEAKAILGTLRDGWRFFVRDRDRKRWRGVSVLAPAPLRHLSDS
jgi:hypothetical protein